MSTERDPLSAPVIRVPDHLRAFVGDTAHDGDMRAAVKARLLVDFDGLEFMRPWVDEVLARALREAAEGCIVQADWLARQEPEVNGDVACSVALRYLAAWLDPETHQRPDEEPQR